MRTTVCGLAALVACGVAAAAAPPRSVTAPAPVTTLAFDGVRVAYAAGAARGDCDRIRVWNLKTRAVAKLGRRTHCELTSTGRGIASLAIAGNRVLWLHYVGGNTRAWTIWTATTTRPAPRRLRFVALDVEKQSPLVVGDGDSSRLGDILPYALDRTVIALRASGARRFSWIAPARVVALSAHGGELAVAQEDGTVHVLDASGTVGRSERYGFEIIAVKVTGTRLLVQHGRTLELRTGGTPKTWILPAGARLADATGDRAFYVHRGRVHRLSLVDGRDEVVARGSAAQAEGATIAVASGRRVTVRRPSS